MIDWLTTKLPFARNAIRQSEASMLRVDADWITPQREPPSLTATMLDEMQRDVMRAMRQEMPEPMLARQEQRTAVEMQARIAEAIRPVTSLFAGALGGASASGFRIVEDASLVDRVEDWSACRSPSRARRRQRLGYPQRVVVREIPRKEVFVIHAIRTIVVHPAVADAVRREIAR